MPKTLDIRFRFRVEVYSQENSELKRRLDGLESANRSLLGQLRQLQQAVNKSGGSPNKRSSPSSSTSGVVSYSSSSSTSASSSSSACLMVFLLCFAALFAGHPTHPRGDSGFHIGAVGSAITSGNSGHIVGDLTSFSSIHQVCQPKPDYSGFHFHVGGGGARSSFLDGTCLEQLARWDPIPSRQMALSLSLYASRIESRMMSLGNPGGN